MSETPKRRKRTTPTYQHKKNAVCVTVYHPHGDTIPAEVRKEIEDSVCTVAKHHKLLINTALT